MISSYIFLSICLATSVSIAETDYGYEYDYDYWEDPHESWEDTKATSNIPKFMSTAKNGQSSNSNPSQNTVSRKNWTPAPPKRKTFQALVRDVASERQAVFGIPLGVAIGIGGVS